MRDNKKGPRTRSGGPFFRKMRSALAAHHADRYAPDLALRADRDRLLVAAGRQIQRCRETGGLDDDLDLTATGPALQVAVDIAARLVPGADNAIGALGGDIAAEIEFVGSPAANAFGRSVGQRDRPVAGPGAVKTGERSRLGVAGGHGHHESGADAGNLDRLPKQIRTKPFHIALFP